ncbi:MAG: hypothetical protein ACI4AE_05235 [Candidatus Cryptobacteroides sp.]
MKHVKIFPSLYVFVSLLFYGCAGFESNDFQYDSASINENITTTLIDLVPPVDSFSIHEVTGTIAYHQNDPYTLANFQQAILNIAANNTKASNASLLNNSSFLEPTHYALKIYPKSENEQWLFELMDDISVSYLPFDYVPVPEPIIQQLDSLSLSHINECIIDSRYNVSYDVWETESDTFNKNEYYLPVLYVIWPKSKPLPENTEYEIDYEIFIPDYSLLTKSSDIELLKTIENEAIRIAVGRSSFFTKAVPAGDIKTLKGKVDYYDTFLNKNIPQENLKIRFQLGSKISDTYTLSDGTFSITDEISPLASYIHIFQHPKWKLTKETSTAAHTVNWGTVEDIWEDEDEPYMNPVSSPSFYSALPAVNHYYKGNSAFRTWSYPSGIRIIMPGTVNEEYSGLFYSAQGGVSAYIVIYENNVDNNYNRFVGTILHEFGHFTHFCESGANSASFSAINKLIKESYASYVGNYLCESYFVNKGYVKPNNTNTFTGQSRQQWRKTDLEDYYSPLFVDLFDDFNQGANTTRYNNDQISSFSHSVVRSIAEECVDWDDVKSILANYINIYYTQEQYNLYTAPYDEWFTNNNL